MASDIAARNSIHSHSEEPQSPVQGEKTNGGNHLENVSNPIADLAHADDEVEPEFHTRTYFALIAMFFLNFVQVLALQGPPAVVSFIFARYRPLN